MRASEKRSLIHAKVHFIGIGGIGMCGLAELLKSMGAKVTGSDLAENAQVQRLRELEIPVFIGHDAQHIGDAEVIVYSSAVKSENSELRAARARGVPAIPRAEALAELMRLNRGIAVGGSHGKTTTTSMTSMILLEAGLEPTIVVGGRFDHIGATAKLGGGEWMVAEADESDGSFAKLSPEIVIITNIDNDHIDHFGNFENLKRAFLDFGGRIPFYGFAVVCGDDPVIHDVFHDFRKRKITYGFDSQNDAVISLEGKAFFIQFRDRRMGPIELAVPGKYNILNATASFVAAVEIGVDPDIAKEALLRFQGVDRRFQKRGEAAGVVVIDDYGHHPTEVAAVLGAARERFPERKIKVLFQPHRYSRTQLCWDQFKDCFVAADQVWIVDIYAAGEAPLPGISSENLVREIRLRTGPSTSIEHLATPKPIEGLGALIASRLEPGDAIFTLGAGDIWKVGPAILERLSERAT